MERQQQGLIASIGLLILRLGIGGLMVTHGWGKVQMVAGGQLSEFGDPIGLGPAASLVLITFAEFVCAILVMIGLGTRLAAIPVVIGMGVAAFIVHADDSLGTKEPALLFFTGFLALVFTGPGRIAIDALLWSKKPRTQAPQDKPATHEPATS